MLGKRMGGGSIENSTLVAFNENASQFFTNQRRSDEKPQVWCDNCNKPCYNQETYWKILGRPTN